MLTLLADPGGQRTVRVVGPVGLRSASAVVLVLVGCGNGTSATLASGADVSGHSCADAAMPPLLSRRDAGPACVMPGGACPPASADAGPPPNRVSWLCFSDSDCGVFPDDPYCDGGHCSKAQATVTCVANAQNLYGLPNPEVSHTFTGTNGTFADHCDSVGNLVGYECETMAPPCGPGPNGCWGPEIFTGRVVTLPEVVDCAGTCRGARCDGRCPAQGDRVTFKGEDATGGVMVHNDSDGRTYVCAVDPSDQHGGNFDCATSAGQTGFVDARSVSDNHCTGAAFGNIAVVVDGVATPTGLSTCGYVTCNIFPTSNCAPF